MGSSQAVNQAHRLIFISHANPEDNDFTAWLAARLASAGYQVWSDLTHLVGGEVFWKDIEEAIRHHSVKFLSILSPAAPKKRGFMKELSVADAVEGAGQRGDFVIPLRIGDIPYSDIPILIHNKNAIDFMGGWHVGLARLLEKLDKDNVPRESSGKETALSDWARHFLHLGEGVVRADEKVMSNWLPIEALPLSIRISSFSLTPKNITALKQQWPCRLVGHFLISFARAQDFDTPLDMGKLKNEVEVETAVFLEAGVSSLRQLSQRDRANILTDLLRQAWELFAQARGYCGFALANGQYCWYLPKTQPKIERVRFVDALGGTGRRALLGESKKLKAFWHLGMELIPSVGRKHRYTLIPHVIFTVDGHKPIGDASQMHRLRRRFCKLWWQDRWRDLTSAYLAETSSGAASLSFSVAPGRSVSVGTAPQVYISPIKTPDETVAEVLVDERLDDADLLYDETTGDEDVEVSDEDLEEATE